MEAETKPELQPLNWDSWDERRNSLGWTTKGTT